MMIQIIIIPCTLLQARDDAKGLKEKVCVCMYQLFSHVFWISSPPPISILYLSHVFSSTKKWRPPHPLTCKYALNTPPHGKGSFTPQCSNQNVEKMLSKCENCIQSTVKKSQNCSFCHPSGQKFVFKSAISTAEIPESALRCEWTSRQQFCFSEMFVRILFCSCWVYFLGPFRAFLVFCNWSGWSELGFGLSRLPAAIAYTDRLS